MHAPSSRSLISLVGLELTPNNHPEKVISALTGFLGILLVVAVTVPLLGPTAAMPVVASMGASAVLLFAAPHGPLSQPWPFVGGHLLAALAGVVCQKFIPAPLLAAPASVALAFAAMYYARCVHPPGGATALTAVLAGPAVHALGFKYLLAPVGVNVAVLLVAAVALNYPFAWRRYPAALVRRKSPPPTATPVPAHEHLAYALRQMGSLIDVSEDDLAEIYSLALHHAAGTHLSPDQIRVGRCYANSPTSPKHAIRQVVDELPGATPEQDMVLYWTLAGEGPHRSAVCLRTTFALWAREEVPASHAFAAASNPQAPLRPRPRAA